eukprot:scaffold680424_cov57-Prasinocladus_malaysianus.AAC.1
MAAVLGMEDSDDEAEANGLVSASLRCEQGTQTEAMDSATRDRLLAAAKQEILKLRVTLATV